MALMDVAHGPARSRLSAMFDWLCSQAREVGGLVVINFHTNYIADIDAPDVHSQFADILSKIRTMVESGRASCLTLSQVAEHIRGEIT